MYILSILLAFVTGAALAGAAVFALHRRRIVLLEKVAADRAGLINHARHRLGNPIATFKWWLEILKEKLGEKGCHQEEVYEEMAEGIKRLEAITQILDAASQIGGGSISASPLEEASLPDIVRDAIDRMRRLFQRKQQTVYVSNDPTPMLRCMRLDRGLITSVVEELLTNASGYSEEGATIEVRMWCDGDAAHVEVKDHGSGIGERDLSRIFKKFVRGQDAAKHKQGSGLGLYIARDMVQRAGGDMKVDSKEGAGTTVTFTVPVR